MLTARRGTCTIALWLAAAAAPAAPWQAEFAVGADRVDNGSADWRQAELALRRRGADGSTLELRHQEAERYGRRDGELGVAASLVPLQDWVLTGRASAGRSGAFLPRTSAQVEATRRLGGGWVAGGGFGRSRHESGGGTSTLRLTVEHYAGAWRLATSGLRARLDGGAAASGWTVQADHYWSDGAARLGVLVAGGREIEHDVDGTLGSRVDAVVVQGRRPLPGAWALVGAVGSTRVRAVERLDGPRAGSVGNGYRRLGVRLGAQLEF